MDFLERGVADIKERCRADLRREPIPLYSEELQLALLWSAKAGCTFAVKWFFSHAGVLREATSYPPDGWVHDYRMAVFCSQPGYILGIERVLAPTMRVVKFVRNPFERCVSAYLAYCQAAVRDPRSEHGSVVKGISGYLSRTVTPEQTFSFREFVGFLETLDLDSCDPHIARQVSTCERFGLMRHIEIVPIETSATLLPALEQRLGFAPTDLATLRQSEHHTLRHDEPAFFGDTQFTKTVRYRMPKTQSFYDGELVAKVRMLYGEDFVRYGYPFDLRDPTGATGQAES